MRKGELYQSFATEKGYEYYQTSRLLQLRPVIKGKHSDLSFEIYEEVVGYGKSKRTYTLIKFFNSPFDFEFKIGKEHFFSKMGKIFGFRDIEFRNEKFDSTFLLKSKDEEKFRAIMSDGFQSKLLLIADDLKGTIDNQNGELKYISQQEILKEERIKELDRVLSFMIEFITQRR